MDMSQSTRIWSELHGIAVVSLADGKKIGTCDDIPKAGRSRPQAYTN